MAQTMTPSGDAKTMTAGQIDKAVGNYRAMLEKHVGDFQAEAVQTVLGMAEVAHEMFDLFRKRVETVANIVARTVKVDLSQTPEEALKATGRRQYVDANVVAAMPKGEGEDVTVYFFKPRPEAYDRNGLINDNNLEKEFEFMGFKPADPYSLAKVNAEDPAFADEHPNGTHWKDANGKWCFAAFDRWNDERRVHVHRNDNEWNDRWFFAGVRK